MSKHPQNRFRRLVIVGPTDKKTPPTLEWAALVGAAASQVRTDQSGITDHPGAIQIPPHGGDADAFPRHVACGVGLDLEFCRSSFARPAERKRGAVVLSFRRAAAKDAFVTKKASGSVCWNNDE